MRVLFHPLHHMRIDGDLNISGNGIDMIKDFLNLHCKDDHDDKIIVIKGAFEFDFDMRPWEFIVGMIFAFVLGMFLATCVLTYGI